MYIERVPNRSSPPAILLRESYRENGKVRKRTIANLSKCPPELIEALSVLLKGGIAIPDPYPELSITRSRSHGHVAAILGTLRKLGLDRILAASTSAQRQRVIALIVTRIIAPGSELFTERGLDYSAKFSSLAETLDIETDNQDDFYDAMDWLLQRQDRIEKRLAKRHLRDGLLVLYEFTSTFSEEQDYDGLAQYAYSIDDNWEGVQIVLGLLCNHDGCPVGVEIFEDDTYDPEELSTQIDKIRDRFGISRVVLVSGRGMLTKTRIRDEIEPAGLDWISALRKKDKRDLVISGAVKLSLFDETNLAEIQNDAYPGERLVMWRDKRLASDRARKREKSLQATEALLDSIVVATKRDKCQLKDKETITLRVGEAIGKYKTAKYFDLEITDNSFKYRRKNDSIEVESVLDGIYIVRTSLPATELDAEQTVRAFRSLKTVDLKERLIYDYTNKQVRAHMFLCMLAYYVELHMRQSLKPLLLDGKEPEVGQGARLSVGDRTEASSSAEDEARRNHAVSKAPAYSFHFLLEELGMIYKNRVVLQSGNAESFDVISQPTELQKKALDLLEIQLNCK